MDCGCSFPYIRPIADPLQAGGLGGLQPPQFLAKQVTLSQPGGQIMPTPVLQAPPDFQTLRRAWIAFIDDKSLKIFFGCILGDKREHAALIVPALVATKYIKQ